MALLYVPAKKCPGSGEVAGTLNVLPKRRRTDRPGLIRLGLCSACGQWIGTNASGQLRPHRRSA